MSEEVLIPKMKRVDKTQRRIKIPLVNFAIIIFCVLMIIAATFVNIDLRHYILPYHGLFEKNLTENDFIYSFSIIPQIPVIMFICSSVGKRMAVTSTLLYIIAGLFFIPVFALGGGIRYIAEYGFGYILGYIPGIIISGNILRKKYSFLNLIAAAILGVLTIHVSGMVYMLLLSVVKHENWAFISGWIGVQSGLKMAYDIIISFVAMLIGKYIHSAVRFILN